jgi:superfamily II DNA or RNA helicase
MKRKVQIETEQAVDGIIAGAPIQTILIKATPGAGKSAIPIIVGKLKIAGIVDALAWTVPRKSLQYQGESNFQDPFFREMFKHNLSIRASTNETNPCRDQDGFVTTYQAIGMDRTGILQDEMRRKRYALVLDEHHHLEYQGVWHKAIEPIVKHAKILILMTGTLELGDKKQIAFTPYRQIGSELEPDLRSSNTTRIIEYSRQDALQDRAIIPLEFHFHDGAATWETSEQKTIKLKSIASAQEHQAGAAIYTALSTEYATELLTLAIDHWKNHRRFNTRSKLLVVTANIKHAKKAIALLKKWNLAAEIATSHESIEAQAAIKRFKYRDIDILVTIAIAYEGLDVPAITHIVCLTHIRSTPWILQMFGRAVRVDHQAGPYENQFGYIFAPDDPRFRKIVNHIRAEQLPIVRKYKKPEQFDFFDKAETTEEVDENRNIYNIKPLESSLTGKRNLTLAQDGDEKILLTPSTAEIKTPEEIESGLRKQIENQVRVYCFKNRYDNRKINAEIQAYFQRPRADMTIAELGKCLAYVQRNYSTARIRGTGRPRVPTKVRPWPEKKVI